MQKNSDSFSMQEALRLAQTPAGQQLIAMLKNSKDPALDQARQQVSKGNYADAKAALGDLLNSPQVQQLLKEMGNKP